MTTFTTYRERYIKAMNITTPEAAREEFEYLLQTSSAPTRDKAIVHERENLGYFAGYFDRDVRARVEQLFHCVHPIFGPVAEQGVPDPHACFQLGLDMARYGVHARYPQPTAPLDVPSADPVRAIRLRE